MGGCAGDPQGDVGCVTAERVVTQKVEEKRKKKKKEKRRKVQRLILLDVFNTLPDDK